MTVKRDKRIDGESDSPLPKRSDTLSTEDEEKLEKLFQKYPDLKEKYRIKAAREIHKKTLEKYGIKPFKVRYISDIPSIFFERGEVYEAFMPRDSRLFYGFFLEGMDEPGEYALPADRFERADEDVDMSKSSDDFWKATLELDDLVEDGLYCVPPSEEDLKAFAEHARKRRETVSVKTAESFDDVAGE